MGTKVVWRQAEEGQSWFCLTAAMKAPLPEYLMEAAMWLQELKITATECRKPPEMEEKRTPGAVETEDKEEAGKSSPTEETQSTEARPRNIKEIEGKEVSKEKAVCSDIYGQVVGKWLQQVTLYRQVRSEHISAY